MSLYFVEQCVIYTFLTLILLGLETWLHGYEKLLFLQVNLCFVPRTYLARYNPLQSQLQGDLTLSCPL